MDNRMRNGFWIVWVLVLLASGCQKPPDFIDARGNGHRLSDYQGKWVLVNYWATWCGPCIKEIPELNQLAETHAKRLVILGVDYDLPKGEELRDQVRAMKIQYPVIAGDPKELLGITEPDVLPTTFVFAPGMKLKATLVGPQTEASILAAMGQPSS